MSDSLTLLFLLGMAGVVLGILFLYITYFRSRWYWGVACLLLPPLLLLLIPLHWRRAQYGLYTLLAGVLVAVAALYAGADGPVQAWLERPQVEPYLAKLGWRGEIHMPFKPYKPGPLPNAAQAQAVRSQEAAERRAAAEAALKKQLAEKSVHKTPNAFQPANLKSLGQFVGRKVRVTSTDGGKITGELKRVDSAGVSVTVAAGGGGVTYHFVWKRVSGVEVYAPEGSVPPPSNASSENAGAASGTLAPPTSSSTPAASTTVSPTPKVAPLPSATTHTPTTPVVAPAASTKTAATASSPAASATVTPAPKVTPSAAPTTPVAPAAAPTSSAPATTVTLRPTPKVVPLPSTTTQTPTMPIAPPAAASQAPSSAVDGSTGNSQ